MGFREFVAIVASLMAVNALAIDAMLPALPQIGEALSIATENQRQFIITAYLLGFGVAQLAYGPLSDRFGRRPVLLFGLVIYTIASCAAMLVTSFDQMIFARLMQGVGSAAARVLAVSIVRDCYSGRQMARVMSIAFIMFILVPVIAPSVGQAIVLVAPWEWIFLVLGLAGFGLASWIMLRLPETLPPERRNPIVLSAVFAAFRLVATNRLCLGYTLAAASILGCLFGFINSAQQIFVDVFDTGSAFPIYFASIALFMALSSFVNSRIVERYGTRVVSHTGLLAFTSIAIIHASMALSGHESLVVFLVLQSLMMFCFGLVMSNFSAMAMDPVGMVAGTAASFQGFVTTVGGALLGFYIGQHYDGTATPVILGYACLGMLSIVIVLITEKGRLFRPTVTASR
ncbi:multidrug effflux MFS transporter [Aureimonas fodinaquatilis]|uniref:Bcr/CflA family efflux transporter n=2 Tax=Aureimonas fodinaquatilis TaxID=2565783 RepID=A0A5B0DVH1_9HYPH|nr:multidrug effflux MFS transporter [Aureimonas fodinaquatilis]